MFRDGKPLGPPRRVLYDAKPPELPSSDGPGGWCITEPCPEKVQIKLLAHLLRVKPFMVVAELVKMGIWPENQYLALAQGKKKTPQRLARLANANHVVPFETALELLRHHGYTIQEA